MLVRSSERLNIGLLASGIVAVVLANAVAQVVLNAWYGPFYNAIEQRDLRAFVAQLGTFAEIAAVLLVLVVSQTWLHESLKIKLRAALTGRLLDHWLRSKRPYRLGLAGDIGTNPDQRIQEDVRHLAELLADLGVGLLQAGLLLVTFVGVLWTLSEDLSVPFGAGTVAIPGYMVWCALAYAGLGSGLSWLVGRSLIRLNAERYGREAEFRFAIVRVSEAAETIALAGAESAERQRLDCDLDRVCGTMRRLANGLARLTWVTSGYGWLAIVVPFIVAAPGYFSGGLSFGGLMVAVNAFSQVQQALRWFVDNFARIADWRATLSRVMAFHRALDEVEAVGEGEERIVIEQDGDAVTIDRLSVALADGQATLDVPHAAIEPGERVLIVGEPSSGKSTLFRAVAGLWPWGTGTIRLPSPERIMFMPQRPYLAPDTLRTVLTSPAGPGAFPQAALLGALERTGLSHLAPKMDEAGRWDRDLPLGEQQRLAFARLLLHKPSWVFFDEAISALDAERRSLVLSIFRTELAGTAVISTSRSAGPDPFYGRTLRLVRQPTAAAAAPWRRRLDRRPPQAASAPQLARVLPA